MVAVYWYTSHVVLYVDISNLYSTGDRGMMLKLEPSTDTRERVHKERIVDSLVMSKYCSIN